MSDLNGDVLHAAIGLPPTLEVTEARVGKLELKVWPSLNARSFVGAGGGCGCYWG
jgi:hypothetical protein